MEDRHVNADRKAMEKFLDYEMRGALTYPLWPILEFCGFLPLIGWYYGQKVNRKYNRYLQRPSLMDAIVAERGPDEGFH